MYVIVFCVGNNLFILRFYYCLCWIEMRMLVDFVMFGMDFFGVVSWVVI